MKEEAEAAVETAKSVLQDLVVVVSLVRTLSESFGSASDLYRKLKRKSKADSHSSDDGKEDHEKKHRRPFRRRRGSDSDSGRERSHRRHVRWKLDAEKDEYSDSGEELISTSSSQVLAEYDRGYRKLGEGFARGDLVTQIQLQAQIIQLQRTLLGIHQDYMLSTYLSPSSSHSHLLRLIQTTRSARMASIQALHMQYQRMLETSSPSNPDPCRSISGAYPMPPESRPRHDSMTDKPESKPRRDSWCDRPLNDPDEITIQPYPKPRPRPRSPDRVIIQPYPNPQPKPRPADDITIQPHPKPRPNDDITIQPYPNPRPRPKSPEKVTIQPYPTPRPKPSPPQWYKNKLFCIYARDLQKDPRLPLAKNYEACGDNMCPFCHAFAYVRPGKAWEILAESCDRYNRKRYRFLIKNRFMIKSHRQSAGFACVLCARFRESDTVCRDVGALIEHLWRDHPKEELEKDEDIFEIDE